MGWWFHWEKIRYEVKSDFLMDYFILINFLRDEYENRISWNLEMRTDERMCRK